MSHLVVFLVANCPNNHVNVQGKKLINSVYILAIRVLAQGCKNGEQNSLAILDMDDFKVQTLEIEFTCATNPMS